MLNLALLWHQHRPIYKDTSYPTQAGSYTQPWVRLHAVRDYYSMAALVAEHPNVHLTMNLTPALLWQLEDYLEHGATDESLELALMPAEELSARGREQILQTFFDAHWHHQIFPHPRYKELFGRRQDGQEFADQDIRDLQMWFNLAWFGQEFRDADVGLVTGEVVSVHRFVEQARDFRVDDVRAMVSEQYKIMRAIIPIHRRLQDQGQIEVSTSPFYHPILPLIMDTDRATIDRDGAGYPSRFSCPTDADAQVEMAVEYYKRSFGLPPAGMWPAEGAVSQSIVPVVAKQGINWIATDRGILARSGRWGYNVEDPDVLCRPYRAEEGRHSVSVFFRDTALSDAIGFHYFAYGDSTQAARDFLQSITKRFARSFVGHEDRILSIILDGENAWGAYPEDARPFLHALYGLLEREPAIRTVTFNEYLAGNPARRLASHPLRDQTQVYELFNGSWIDENGSRPGVDLGTWIGEDEENRAWDLLGAARALLAERDVTPETAPAAFHALYTAEGSDWFWWFGTDQDSGNDAEFDDLFRVHLRNVYLGQGTQPPLELERHLVPRAVTWTFVHQISSIQPGDRLTVRTNCPGRLTWRLDDREPQVAELLPVGGVLGGIRRYQLTLGPFALEVGGVRFRFDCAHPGCPGNDLCCSPREHVVVLGQPAAG